MAADVSLALKEETTPLLRLVVSSYVPSTAYENEMNLKSLSLAPFRNL